MAVRSPSGRGARRSAALAGFTLVEVMITLAILGFGLLALGAMQLVAIKQGSAGRHTGDGAAIARSYLEQAARVPWATLTAAAGGGWVAPGWAGIPNPNVNMNLPGGGTSTEHTYTVLWRVTNVGAAPICLRDVEVQVSWQEEGFSVPKTYQVGTRRYNQGDASC